MTTQLESSLTPDQWQQRVKEALARAAEVPHELGGQKGGGHNQLSIRRLIWNQADDILALRDKGIGYRVIAEQLTESGIPITQAVLKSYICDYRKQKGQAPVAGGGPLTVQDRKLMAMELAKRVRL